MADDVVVPFDRAKSRYYTRASAQSRETDPITFRASSSEIRKIDEIVASRIEPELKTRSDVINDALHRWLENFFAEHSDDMPGLADRFRLEHIKHLYDSRQQDIDLLKETLDQAVRENNQGVLQPILYNAMRLKNELEKDPFASPKHIGDVKDLVKTTQQRMGVKE